jgi:hypothetical protein
VNSLELTLCRDTSTYFFGVLKKIKNIFIQVIFLGKDKKISSFKSWETSDFTKL